MATAFPAPSHLPSSLAWIIARASHLVSLLLSLLLWVYYSLGRQNHYFNMWVSSHPLFAKGPQQFLMFVKAKVIIVVHDTHTVLTPSSPPATPAPCCSSTPATFTSSLCTRSFCRDFSPAWLCDSSSLPSWEAFPQHRTSGLVTPTLRFRLLTASMTTYYNVACCLMLSSVLLTSVTPSLRTAPGWIKCLIWWVQSWLGQGMSSGWQQVPK